MNNFVKVFFLILVIIVLLIITKLLFKEVPEIQMIFYFPAFFLLLYALFYDYFLPRKGFSAKKRSLLKRRRRNAPFEQ